MAEKVGSVSLPPPGSADTMGDVQRRTVLIPLFDGVQTLDFTGPLEVLHGSGGYRVATASLDRRPVRSSSGLLVTPDTDLGSAAPPHTLLVPGGSGTRAPDPALVAWLREADTHTAWTASVCSGSLILAAAGLLTGRRATTHWIATDTLGALGAVPSAERYVIDGKYATAAGVSAGIDLALHLAGRLAGDTVAKAVQLAIEYDPQPPYDSGRLAGADQEVIDAIRSGSQPLLYGDRR
jgi:transcriptional regulator GlxA family with amidase domain